MPTLFDMVDDARALECRSSTSVALRITIHVTRCPTSSPITLLQEKRLSNPFTDEKAYHLSGITVARNRPNFGSILRNIADEVIDRARNKRIDPSGICVTACGPGSMVDAVRDAARRLDAGKKRAAGGLDYEDEHFGL